jgi:hypothetical protein
VVSQVQTPGRRCRFFVSFPNPWCKSPWRNATSTRRSCLYPKVHVSASDGGCATPKPKESSPAHSRRRRFLTGRPQAALVPLGSLQRLSPDLHSMPDWTTILSK